MEGGKLARNYRIFKKDPIVGFNDVLNIAEDRMRKLEESLGETALKLAWNKRAHNQGRPGSQRIQYSTCK